MDFQPKRTSSLIRSTFQRFPSITNIFFYPFQTLLHVVSLEEDEKVDATNKPKNRRALNVTYQASNLFVFHHINCYEDKEKGWLIVDVVAYNDAQVSSPYNQLLQLFIVT